MDEKRPEHIGGHGDAVGAGVDARGELRRIRRPKRDDVGLGVRRVENGAETAS
jgi:hypothetical protein